jgi:transposase
VIHRIWPHIRVSSRRPRHAEEHDPGNSPRGASPDAGCLRRGRYGYLLVFHILLLCAGGRNPTAIADVLFCSRSSVYRTVRAYRAGTLGLEPDEDGRLSPPVRTTVLVPAVRRSLVALLKAAPRAYGWCHTRWSCATLVATLQTKRGRTVSAETMRRWVHEIG